MSSLLRPSKSCFMTLWLTAPERLMMKLWNIKQLLQNIVLLHMPLSTTGGNCTRSEGQPREHVGEMNNRECWGVTGVIHDEETVVRIWHCLDSTNYNGKNNCFRDTTFTLIRCLLTPSTACVMKQHLMDHAGLNVNNWSLWTNIHVHKNMKGLEVSKPQAHTKPLIALIIEIHRTRFSLFHTYSLKEKPMICFGDRKWQNTRFSLFHTY